MENQACMKNPTRARNQITKPPSILLPVPDFSRHIHYSRPSFGPSSDLVVLSRPKQTCCDFLLPDSQACQNRGACVGVSNRGGHGLD